MDPKFYTVDELIEESLRFIVRAMSVLEKDNGCTPSVMADDLHEVLEIIRREVQGYLDGGGEPLAMRQSITNLFAMVAP